MTYDLHGQLASQCVQSCKRMNIILLMTCMAWFGASPSLTKGFEMGLTMRTCACI